MQQTFVVTQGKKNTSEIKNKEKMWKDYVENKQIWVIAMCTNLFFSVQFLINGGDWLKKNFNHLRGICGRPKNRRRACLIRLYTFGFALVLFFNYAPPPEQMTQIVSRASRRDNFSKILCFVFLIEIRDLQLCVILCSFIEVSLTLASITFDFSTSQFTVDAFFTFPANQWRVERKHGEGENWKCARFVFLISKSVEFSI